MRKIGNKLAKQSERLEDVVSFLLTGALIFFMMFFIGFEVLARLIFNISFLTVVDLTELLIIVICFAGLAGVQREGGHIRMDLLLEKLLKKRVGLFVEAFNMVLSAIFFAGLIYIGTKYTLNLFQTGQQTLVIYMSVWPFALVVPLGATLMCIRLIIQAGQWIRRAQAQ